MPKQRGRVIVVGSSNTDLVVHCDCLPSGGETVLGKDMQTFAGGKGANQAVAAARAGARVLLVGAFGDDAFGKARRKDLEKEGIDCRGCLTKKGVPSGVALIAIGKGGKGSAKAENQIVVAPGANMRLTPADVKRGMPKDLSQGDVVLGSLEVPLAALEAAFAAANKAGATAILNPAPMQPKGKLKKLLRLAATVTPNEHEFEALTGRKASEKDLLKKLAKMFHPHTNCGRLIVTRGARGVRCLWVVGNDDAEFQPVKKGLTEHLGRELGCYLGSDEFRKSLVALCREIGGKDGEDAAKELESLPGDELEVNMTVTLPETGKVIDVASPRVKPVDTVGAGDCFNGALAAELAREPGRYEPAMRFAVAAAAISVTRHGAQASMPRRSEILKMIKRIER
ncbi:MAG: PfkB family carbohydrate kinase [Planctomycetes bacterium]|nr:PfkB family carbohydrate kinase [Planctomycetota bacterium]